MRKFVLAAVLAAAIPSAASAQVVPTDVPFQFKQTHYALTADSGCARNTVFNGGNLVGLPISKPDRNFIKTDQNGNDTYLGPVCINTIGEFHKFFMWVWKTTPTLDIMATFYEVDCYLGTHRPIENGIGASEGEINASRVPATGGASPFKNGKPISIVARSLCAYVY